MTELDIGVIYLQNIQRNEHKYNTMSCPHVHTTRDTRLRHPAATKHISIQRPAGVATVRRSSRSSQTQQTPSPQYLSQHISLRTSARNTRSSSVPLLCVPFARRSFSTAAPLTWNSLSPAVLNCDFLSTFKFRLKIHLFSAAFC